MPNTIELYANNASTTLAGSANNTVTTLVLQSGAGALFPSPNNTLGEYAKATLQDFATGLRNEIVYITARTGDVLTVTRGQDGSSAQTWSAGDKIFEGVTAATLAGFVQPSKLQSGQYVYSDATGTTSAYIATLTPGIATVNAGLVVRVNTNSVGTNTTTTPTLNVNELGAFTIVKQGGALVLGDMPKMAQLQYDSTLTQWVLLNPAELSIDSGIKTIGATVASSALTITAQPTILDFRSATLTSGAVLRRTIATALSLVVPSTATLGTISAQKSRLIVLAIDNAGTVELAVSNITSGYNFDETTLMSTNAITTVATGTGVIAVTTGVLTISGSPTGTWQVGQIIGGTSVPAGTYITALGTGTGGAGTYQTNITTAVSSTAMTGVAGMSVYSAVARTNMPFRVLGFIESTQTTAGIWATAPSTIQGAGTGLSVAGLTGFGVGQTAKSYLASRANNVIYYNTTGKPIFVSVIIQSSSASVGANIQINGQISYIGSSTVSGVLSSYVCGIIPPNSAYLVTIPNYSGLGTWTELR